MESLQDFLDKKLEEGTWAIPKDPKERYSKGTYYLKKIEDLKEEIYPIFGDDILFDELDGAIKRLREMILTSSDEIKEGLNEEVTIPPELANQYLQVKKQMIDKQSKKDQLMKSVNQVDNEMNILQKNLVAIETKAADVQGQEKEQQEENTETIEVEAKVKESVDLDDWWKENVTEALEVDEIAELEDEEAPVVDVAADPVDDEVEDEEIVDAPEGESLEGDYVFTLEIEDEGEDENIVAKFYKDEDDDYWKARVVQGSEEPIESMQFDPEMDKVDIIEKLGGMFDDVEEIQTEDYQEMLDDKEAIDSVFYDDIIKEE